MGRTEYRIINGREYLVYINDEGCETVLGDPMKDEAEAHAKAIEDVLNRNRQIDFDTPAPHKFDDEMKERLDAIDKISKRNFNAQSDYDRIIAYHKKAGHYKPDPELGVPHFIDGTDEVNPEWVKRLGEKSRKDMEDLKRGRERKKGIAIVLGFVAIIGLVLLFLHNYR